jgi:NCS2 family nucleobase:cation symporter-2
MHPLTGSMLSLTLIVALVLNLLFRIGIRRTEVFSFEGQDLSPEKFATFVRERGRAWNVSADVIERATSTAAQVIDHIETAHLVQGGARAVVSYDQDELLIEISYEGALLTLPNVGVKRKIFLEEESFSYGLADFLTGVYPDRMESSSRDSLASVRLYFSA